MKQFEVLFSYKVTEWGSVILNVDTEDDASFEAVEYVREAFPDATDIEIDEIKDITIG